MARAPAPPAAEVSIEPEDPAPPAPVPAEKTSDPDNFLLAPPAPTPSAAPNDLEGLFPTSSTPEEAPSEPPPEEVAPQPTPAQAQSPMSEKEWATWVGDSPGAVPPARSPGAPPKEEHPQVLDETPQALHDEPASPPVKASASATRSVPAVPVNKPTERKATVWKPAPSAPASTPAPAPPPSRADRNPLRQWIRSLSCAFAIALAFIAADLVAAFVPGAATRFHEVTAQLRAGMAAKLPLAVLLAVPIGTALILYGILVWQAGNPFKRSFLLTALLLCLVSAAVGLFPVGHEMEAERRIAGLQGQVKSLQDDIGRSQKKLESVQAAAARTDEIQKQLDERNKTASEAAEAAAKQLAGKDQAMTQAVESLERRLREQTARTQEALAEREKLAGTLEKNANAHLTALKLRDDMMSTLRKENEELKKKLAQKP